MHKRLTRLAVRAAAIGMMASAGLASISAIPASAVAKSLSAVTCTQGSLVNGGNFLVGVTYDCTQTASSSSGNAITLSNITNAGGVTASTWLANLAAIGMSITFVNNTSTSPQVHYVGTPTSLVSSGFNYTPSIQTNDGTAPNSSFDVPFRSELQNITATIAGNSGGTSLGSGSGLVTSGSSVTLSATGITLPTGYSIAYQWQKDGVDISGATSSSYTIPSAASTASYTLNGTTSWTDGVHTATATQSSWLGSYSLNIRTGTPVATPTTTTTTTAGGSNSAASSSAFDESNTSSTTLSDAQTLSGISGTATFSDGSQLVIAKSGSVMPRLFTAFKGYASGTLKASYIANKKSTTFTCAYARFGSVIAATKATKSVNNWFPKSFLYPKKACILPKAALTAAASGTVKIVVKLTFGRLWPTTAKAINADTKAVLKPVARTMTLVFGKTA